MNKRFNAPEKYKPGDILLTAKEIDTRLDEIALELISTYKNKNLLLVGLLTGASWLTVDILYRLHILGLTDCELAFIKVSSYTNGTKATQKPLITYNSITSPKNRTLLLVDDIADTGRTLTAVIRHFKNKKVTDIKTLVLLDKPERREVLFIPDYCGFVIPNIWVQGRGLDSNGYGRGDPHIRVGPYY